MARNAYTKVGLTKADVAKVDAALTKKRVAAAQTARERASYARADAARGDMAHAADEFEYVLDQEEIVIEGNKRRRTVAAALDTMDRASAGLHHAIAAANNVKGHKSSKGNEGKGNEGKGRKAVVRDGGATVAAAARTAHLAIKNETGVIVGAGRKAVEQRAAKRARSASPERPAKESRALNSWQQFIKDFAYAGEPSGRFAAASAAYKRQNGKLAKAK